MPTSMAQSEILRFCNLFFPPYYIRFLSTLYFRLYLCYVFFFASLLLRCSVSYRELAKDLGEKGVLVFSDFEHVILKSTPFLFSFVGSSVFQLFQECTRKWDQLTFLFKTFRFILCNVSKFQMACCSTKILCCLDAHV